LCFDQPFVCSSPVHIKQGHFYVSRHVTYKFTDVILKFHLCKFCNNRRCWSLNYVGGTTADCCFSEPELKNQAKLFGLVQADIIISSCSRHDIAENISLTLNNNHSLAENNNMVKCIQSPDESFQAFVII
jgi:hypothetical protein